MAGVFNPHDFFFELSMCYVDSKCYSTPPPMWHCSSFAGTMAANHQLPYILLIFLLLSNQALSLGINYGTLGNDLPSPTQVAAFLQ